MTYEELQKDINDGKVSGAKIKIHIDRYESIYQELSRTALKKLIANAIKKNDVSLQSRCIWASAPDSRRTNAKYHIKLNY